MRIRSRVLLTMGIACLSVGVVAGGALAHGGERDGGKKKAKFAKVSKNGHSALKVEVRGSIAEITDAKITVSAGGALAWSCDIPAGSDVTGFAAGDRVRLNCRSSEGKLVATKLRKRDKGDRLKVEARGTITDLTATSITVAPGGTLPNVTCAITPRTLVFGTPAETEKAKVACRSKNGALVAKRITEKGAMKPGGIQVETKAPIAAVSDTSITVGPTVCAVANPALVAGFKVNDLVEAKCTGSPLTLVRIHHED